jgi:hypothetical protein
MAHASFLGRQVVVNAQAVRRAYVIVRPNPGDARAVPYQRGAISSGRQQLALPAAGFFQALIRDHRPSPREAGPGSIVIRVSIPPGAAILPRATVALGVQPPATPPEPTVLLPYQTLARIQVTKAYTVPARSLGYAASRLSGDLASFTASSAAIGVPQRGSANVSAPPWAWSDDEISEYFLASSEQIEAGWWFHDLDYIAAQRVLTGPETPRPGGDGQSADAASQVQAAQASLAQIRRAIPRIPRIPGETVLVYQTHPDTGFPVLNGRLVVADEFTRVLAVLTARHPSLDQRAFRPVTDADLGYVQQAVNLSRRPMFAATTVFVSAPMPRPSTGDSLLRGTGDSHPQGTGDSLLYGTVVATGTQPGPDGVLTPVMPASGPWYLFRPDSSRLDLSAPVDSSLDRIGPSLGGTDLKDDLTEKLPEIYQALGD